MGLLLVSFGGLVHEWESASCVSISLSGVFVLGLMTGGAGRSCVGASLSGVVATGLGLVIGGVGS